jgi:Na+-driven multidrug efflux pump
VFGLKSKKPRERFYLLPGQGGKNFYRKQRRIMRWTISVALLFGLLIAAVMWWQAHPHL